MGIAAVSVTFVAMDDVPTGTAPGAGVVHYDAYLTRSTNGGASFSGPLKIDTSFLVLSNAGVLPATLTSDCVANDSNFSATFPYLAPAN